MKVKYQCQDNECNDEELIYSQLSNQGIVKIPLIAFSTLEPISSYKQLQTNLIVPPEIPYFKEHYNLTDEERLITIPGNLLSTIFKLNSEKSVLNPINGEHFIDQIEHKVPIDKLKYSNLIGIKSMPFYTFLYKYFKETG